ncbi:MAG: hypothetical protein NT027_18160 [Proteobacteria bacterium]|nr:hypothetical protein [Pseudomonadota bacterium]
MKRTESTKFPSSVQLFKFCQKVMMHQRGNKRVNDQEIGNILEFNPSDCSHWKRGEKSVRSVFSLAKLAETLKVESAIIHDLATGASLIDEAFFEYQESNTLAQVIEKAKASGTDAMLAAQNRVESFVTQLHAQCQFTTPPLYLPEVLRFFSFVQMQPIDMIDRLSRILRTKPGHYAINYRKGDLKSQTRMSVLKDLSRIIFEAERSRFPELGALNESLLAYEQLLFIANLLVPKAMLREEMGRLDNRRNVVSELSALFWVPKSLVCFQIQESVRTPAVNMNVSRPNTTSSNIGARDAM